MKKIILLCLLILLYSQCSTNYNATLEKPLNGNWVINNVTYSKHGIKVDAFGLEDAKCFINSQWNLIRNNHTGSFNTLQTDSCPTVTENITWYINDDKQFVMKFMAEGEKAKEIKKGYVLHITQQTENTFNLVQNAGLDGELIQVTYHFTKK